MLVTGTYIMLIDIEFLINSQQQYLDTSYIYQVWDEQEILKWVEILCVLNYAFFSKIRLMNCIWLVESAEKFAIFRS